MNTAHKQLNVLNKTLGGSISNIDGDRILKYHNHKGTGTAVSVELESGISFTDYDFSLKEDFRFELGCERGPRLYFVYCMQGNINYSWSSQIQRKTIISELQTAILGSNSNTLSILVPRNFKTQFAIIKIEQDKLLRSTTANDYELYQKLFDELLNNQLRESYEYHGNSNLKIREQLLQIRKINQSGIVRKLLVKAVINFVLAFELMHYKYDLTKNNGYNTRLNKNELKRVQAAIDTISENPQRPYSLSQICRAHGLSASKLQDGFKVITGFTVSNFVKNKRIEMAEKLIKEGELNISEVVYSIGLTSRSYFSKIFNAKNQCAPRNYQERCRNLASA